MPVVIDQMEIEQAEPTRRRGDGGGEESAGSSAPPPSEEDFERALEDQLARYERLRAH